MNYPIQQQFSPPPPYITPYPTYVQQPPISPYQEYPYQSPQRGQNKNRKQLHFSIRYSQAPVYSPQAPVYSPQAHQFPSEQPTYYSINENPYNNQFIPNNLFYMNSFYARQNGSNSKKDAGTGMIQPLVLQRPTYFGENKSDEDEVLDYIRDMIVFDAQLEKLKLQLLSYVDFSISDAYQLFDTNKTGQISIKELKEGLNKLNIYPDDSDLYLLVRRFANDDNNLLSFDEFTLLFIPFSGQPTKSQIQKTNYLGESNYLQMSHLTKKALSSLLKQHLNLEFSLEQIRQNMNIKQVNYKQVYQKIDNNGSGLITADEFMNYLKKKQIIIDRTIFQAVLFRFDKNFSGKIGMQEFLYEFKSKIKKSLN